MGIIFRGMLWHVLWTAGFKDSIIKKGKGEICVGNHDPKDTYLGVHTQQWIFVSLVSETWQFRWINGKLKAGFVQAQAEAGVTGRRGSIYFQIEGCFLSLCKSHIFYGRNQRQCIHEYLEIGDAVFPREVIRSHFHANVERLRCAVRLVHSLVHLHIQLFLLACFWLMDSLVLLFINCGDYFLIIKFFS